MSEHNTSQTFDPRQYSLPEPTIRRLPWYLAYISMLRDRGEESVSSTGISSGTGIDQSLVAKDLSLLRTKGRPRVGYVIDELLPELSGLLGFTRSHRAVMIGVGQLGAALLADAGLSSYGLNIVAGFDVSPTVIGKCISGVPVYDMKSLAERRRHLDAEIAVIAVPVDKAQQAADDAVAAGIKALWNFTPYRIRTAPDIVVQNTSIYSHLAVMYNKLSNRKERKK
ncbi:MAG: redox-sensing transcriptional repressor Rex [Paramuribaculum sp.]|nr:redox-sensing transcriptional repressor Rex [Paramuribaculum sp.]